jgi:hypothetical protein
MARYDHAALWLGVPALIPSACRDRQKVRSLTFTRTNSLTAQTVYLVDPNLLRRRPGREG